MLLRIFFGVLSSLLLTNCSNKDISKSSLDILAQVGDKIITRQDFIRRAEYTIRPDYCRQSNYIHKKIILNSLIAEKITSIEMEDKDDILLNSQNFHYYLQGRKEQAMRKLYYYENFYKGAEAPYSIVNEKYKLAGRTIDISYINLPDINTVQKVKELISQNITIEEIYFSIWGDTIPTKKINFFDKEPDIIHEKLFLIDNKKNQTIGPFEVEDGSFLIMKINGWADTKFISAVDQEKIWEDVEKLVKEKEAKTKYFSFVKKMMSGKSIQFNKDVFEDYAHKASKIYLQDPMDKKDAINKMLWDEIENPKKISLQNNPDIKSGDVIMIFDNEKITVEKLNLLIKSHPLVFRKRKINEGRFRQELKFALADLIRDVELNKKCYDLELHNDIRVKTNVDMWHDAYSSKRFMSSLKPAAKSERKNKYNFDNNVINYLQKKHSNVIKINTNMFENITLTSTDMLVSERGLAYPFIVPSFPVITSDDRLDYGSKLN